MHFISVSYQFQHFSLGFCLQRMFLNKLARKNFKILSFSNCELGRVPIAKLEIKPEEDGSKGLHFVILTEGVGLVKLF